MEGTIQAAAQLLRERDRIVILAHRKPDGDTLGSCFALLYALQALGKTARVECADGYPDRYGFIYGGYAPQDFEAEFVVACDVASSALLGPLAEVYPHVDLCIDHHKSNTMYAGYTLVDADVPAAAQIVYRVIQALGVPIDQKIATALYTGVTTDTGCFRFSSVTPETHRVAAELMEFGAPQHAINKLMFDSKSRGRIEVEKLMLQSLDFALDGRCVTILLPADIHARFSVTEDDLDGVSAFPRRIEGVLCGITIRENGDGSYRVSMRAEPPVDASRICSSFGGGGHTAAAGCTMTGTADEVRAALVEAVRAELAQEAVC